MAEDIFSEARAEHRVMQTKAALRRYAPVAGGVTLAILVAVGVWQWRALEARQERAAASSRYFEAVNSLQGSGANAGPGSAAWTAASATFADLAAHSPADIRDFAALRLATLRSTAHDVPGALAAWKIVADDSDATPELRALAQYLALNARLETGDAEKLRTGFAGLETKGAPWRALAQEGIVALDLRAGSSDSQHDEARRLLTRLTQSPDAPNGVRQRASALLETFGPAPSKTQAPGGAG